MKIPVTKSDIKGILISNSNVFFTTKKVAALKLTGDAAVDRVSTLLYRLRHDSDIERVRSSSSYKYRYVKPTKDKGLVEKPTKERDNNDALASTYQIRTKSQLSCTKSKEPYNFTTGHDFFLHVEI